MTSWRERILDQQRAGMAEWLDLQDDTPRSEDEVDSEQRANWLSAVREWDSDVAYPEELVIRLVGGEAGSGGLKFSVGNALLRPLQEGVTVSSEQDVELELIGVSAGSTVLHVRPVVRDVPLEDGAPSKELPSQPADQAMNQLLDAVGSLEAQADVSDWSPMLSSLSRLVAALDRFDLTVQLKYLSADGAVRSTALTETGKLYLRELRKSQGEQFERERHTFSGRVTELKMSGVAVIKPASNPAITVKFEPGQLAEMGWKLGEYVHVEVEERRRITRRGSRPITDFIFVGYAADDFPLPEPLVELRDLPQGGRSELE